VRAACLSPVPLRRRGCWPEHLDSRDKRPQGTGALLTTGARPGAQVEVLAGGRAPPPGCGRAVLGGYGGGTSIALLLVGLLDPAKEAARLEEKQARPDLLGNRVGLG